MKICDLTQAYTPQSGGIRTYIHEKRKYIQNHTRDEHLLVIPGENDSIIREARFTTITIKAPHIPKCEPYRYTFRLDKVYSILKAERPDVIEIGSPYLMPYPAMLYRRYYPCSIIGFYHTDFPTAYSEQEVAKIAGNGWGSVAKHLSEWYAHKIYNCFDYTATASELLKRKLLKMGIKRVAKIPLGVDADIFHPSRRTGTIRQRFALEDKIVLIYAGRLDSEKRIDVILNAFEKSFNRFNGALMIVGQGPLEPLVMDYAAKHPDIHYIPYVHNKNELAEILASADVYVTAGPHETFGLSIIEAQASGLPVLGVNAGALQERVNPSVGVLVEPGSVTEMANTMFELSTNGFREKGRNARKWVEQEFSWYKTFSKMYRLYEISVNKN